MYISFTVVCILCLWFMCGCDTESYVPCVWENNRTLCLCSRDGFYTDCARRNLSNIPLIPNTTISFNISGNALKRVNKSTLSNISNNYILRLLDFSKNNISNVEKASFSRFHNLQSLNLSSNPLNRVALENSTSEISKTLENLVLESMNLEYFPYYIIHSLNKTHLERLSIKNNSVKVFNGSNILPYLTHLIVLDLSFNSIRELKLTYAIRLKYLSVSSNDLTELPRCCDANRHNPNLFPNLEDLFIDDNCIRQLDMAHINCCENLKLLNMSATRIQTIESNSFVKLKSLQTITIEYTDSLQYLKPYAFNSKSLERIFIRFNRISQKVSDLTKVFRNCSQLKHLDLSGNRLGRLTNLQWFSLLHHIPILEYLDIGYSDMLFLPKAIPHYLTNLQRLHLAYNHYSVIPDNYFKPLKRLRILFLDGNKFTSITEKDLPSSVTGHLTYLNLQYNPFVCDCKLLWFLTFATSNNATLYKYPQHYECHNGKPINSVNINQRSCLILYKTSEIIKCTCVTVIFLLILISVVYRYRWRIRYLIYILRYHRRNYTKCRDLSRIHDVYVSCSEQDFDNVYSQIVCKLENEDGLDVFIPQRDATPGTLIVNHILENLDGSKFVILCLSDSYSQDHWCEFEACMAVERSVHENVDEKRSLIVIMLHEIDSVNVTKVINKLTLDDDYLSWDENEETNSLFWRRLKSLLSSHSTSD